MRKKRIKWLYAVVVVLIVSVMFSINASAIQYNYDALNRLITSEKDDGQTTQYQYDAAGNLLSVTASSTISGSAAGVADGWTPYATAGIDAQYSVVTESVYGTEAADTNIYAVQHIAASGQTGGANVYRDIAVDGQQAYAIDGHVKADQLANAAAQVIVNYYNAQNQLIGYENAVNVLEASGWTSFNKELAVPVDAAKARVHLQLLILETNGSGNAGYAAIEFKPVTAPSGDAQ